MAESKSQGLEPAVGATSPVANTGARVVAYSQRGCPACSWMARTLDDGYVLERLAELSVVLEHSSPRGVRMVPTCRLYVAGERKGQDLVGYHRPAEFLAWVERCL